MGLYSGGLIIGRTLASEIWGGGGAYFRESLFFGGGGLLSEFYGIDRKIRIDDKIIFCRAA